MTNIKQRKTFTRYRLSNHSLAVEKGMQRQAWLPREESMCTNQILRILLVEEQITARYVDACHREALSEAHEETHEHEHTHYRCTTYDVLIF